mmetsp:Transcript_70709/g.199660  ORF Transcript_70709/g.199660 Transcript_70709/m.199660 type:complete len:526 (+) Transcript_70709:81-1658(+)
MGSCCGHAAKPLPAESLDSESNLRSWFLKHYRQADDWFHMPGFQRVPDPWVFEHEASTVKVWRDVLDVSNGAEDVVVLFHYTNEIGFLNITAPMKRATEIWASLVTSGAGANAWWGKGIYTTAKGPDDFGTCAKIIDNNFRRMAQRDGWEVYVPRVAYCIPVMAALEDAYDVCHRATPEMEAAFGVGLNLKGQPLNEPGTMQRDQWVVRLADGEGAVQKASAKLLDTLRQRADRSSGLERWEARGRFSTVLSARGNFAEAEAVCRQTLKEEEEYYGCTNEVTLKTLSSVALNVKEQGRLADAEPLYEQVGDGFVKFLGAKHPDTLKWFNNFARLYEDQRKYTDAEPLFKLAYEGFTELLGPTNPTTLSVANNYAILLSTLGQHEDGEKLMRQTLSACEQSMGAKHPETVSTRGNLAFILQRQGKHDEWEATVRDCLESSEDMLGPDHPQTLSHLDNLASALLQQEKLAEAEPLMWRLLKAYETLYGPRNIRCGSLMHKLIQVLHAQEKWDAAEPLNKRMGQGFTD